MIIEENQDTTKTFKVTNTTWICLLSRNCVQGNIDPKKLSSHLLQWCGCGSGVVVSGLVNDPCCDFAGDG